LFTPELLTKFVDKLEYRPCHILAGDRHFIIGEMPMPKSNEGALSRYVRRKMQEQHLSRYDVSVRSGGGIGDSYVGAIMNGTCTNVSIDKLKALARGLAVEEMEMARVAFSESAVSQRESDSTPDCSLMLIDIKNKTVMSSDVAEITHQVMQLSPRRRGVVLQFVNKLSRDRSKQRTGKAAQR